MSNEFINYLVRYQRAAWYFFSFYFLIVLVLFFWQEELAGELARIGVGGILAATVGKLYFVARQFAAGGLKHYHRLSYLLIILLLAIALIKYYWL